MIEFKKHEYEKDEFNVLKDGKNIGWISLDELTNLYLFHSNDRGAFTSKTLIIISKKLDELK